MIFPQLAQTVFSKPEIGFRFAGLDELVDLAQCGEVVPRPCGHGAPAPLDAGQPYGHVTDRHRSRLPAWPLSPTATGPGIVDGEVHPPVRAIEGCVATFKKRQERDWSSRPGFVSRRHFEQLVNELNLSPNIRPAHPPCLSLPDHVHSLVALDGSPRRLKLAKPLLGFHAAFDRSMILFHDVVHVLDRPVAATASQDAFLFHP